MYAKTVLDSLEAENVDNRQAQIDAARSQLVEATQALNVAQAALDVDPENPRLAAERDAALSGYSTALANATAVEQQELPAVGMTSIEPASASVQEPDGLAGIGVAGRAGLGAALGALVGFAIGLGLDAMDRRIRTAQRCAEAFGTPVIAEVPRARRASADGLAPAGSTVMEAYRRLRTVVQLSAIQRSQGNGHEERPGHVVLVASPGPKEGKTTTAAHLSAALAESGLRVLAVSADFRRPRLDKLLGRPADDSANGLWLLGPTEVPGVDMVMARERTNEPAALLRDVRRLLEVARSKFDVIVIDTAPVLVANDSLELMPLVDDVILVARSRTTTVTAAERTVDVLGQVGAHVLGTVLTQVSATETYAYYGYRYGYGLRSRSPRQVDRAGACSQPLTDVATIDAGFDLGVALVAIAAHGLADAPDPCWPDRGLDDATFELLCASASRERLAGLLLDVVEDGALPASDPQADLAAAHAAEWYQRTRLLDAALLDAHDRLADAGIDHRVIKGPATAVLAYGDTLRRPYVDIDVAIQPSAFADALAVLTTDRWRRLEPDRRPGVVERLAQSVTLTDGSMELDLHRMLVHPPAGDRLPLAPAFDLPARSFELDGVELPGLPIADAIVHSAAHTTFDHQLNATLLRARDLVGLAAHASAAERAERARAWGLEATVESCLSTSRARLGLERGDASPCAPGPDEVNGVGASHSRRQRRSAVVAPSVVRQDHLGRGHRGPHQGVLAARRRDTLGTDPAHVAAIQWCGEVVIVDSSRCGASPEGARLRRSASQCLDVVRDPERLALVRLQCRPCGSTTFLVQRDAAQDLGGPVGIAHPEQGFDGHLTDGLEVRSAAGGHHGQAAGHRLRDGESERLGWCGGEQHAGLGHLGVAGHRGSPRSVWSARCRAPVPALRAACARHPDRPPPAANRLRQDPISPTLEARSRCPSRPPGVARRAPQPCHVGPSVRRGPRSGRPRPRRPTESATNRLMATSAARRGAMYRAAARPGTDVPRRRAKWRVATTGRPRDASRATSSAWVMWAWITSVSVRRIRAQVRGPGRAAWCTHAGTGERRSHPLSIATEDDDLEARLHLGRRHVGEVALHAGERRRGDEVDDLHRSARRVNIAAHGTGHEGGPSARSAT